MRERPSREELEAMAGLLGHARELVATRSKYFKESGLDLDKDSQARIILALAAQPLMLKRPLLYDGSRALAGFNEESYREFFR